MTDSGRAVKERVAIC